MSSLVSSSSQPNYAVNVFNKYFRQMHEQLKRQLHAPILALVRDAISTQKAQALSASDELSGRLKRENTTYLDVRDGRAEVYKISATFSRTLASAYKDPTLLPVLQAVAMSKPPAVGDDLVEYYKQVEKHYEKILRIFGATSSISHSMLTDFQFARRLASLLKIETLLVRELEAKYKESLKAYEESLAIQKRFETTSLKVLEILPLDAKEAFKKGYSTLDLLIDNQFVFVDEKDAFITPAHPSWGAKILALNLLGTEVNFPNAGHALEEFAYGILGDPRYLPSQAFFYSRTPAFKPVESFAERVELPLLELEETKVDSPEPIAEVEKQILPVLDPVVETLIAGFKVISVHDRVSRWKEAQWDQPINKQHFPEYRADDPFGWKKDIIRHKMPFYLCLGLDKKLLTFYEQEKGKWVLPCTLYLPGDMEPIKGYAEVSRGDNGVVYHNYFMAERQDAVSKAISKLRAFVPQDTFYQHVGDIYNNFGFLRNEEGITIEDTLTGVTAVLRL